MRVNTINLQIVKNLGNYETLRIGAEWTPDGNQTLADAMAAGMAELNATAEAIIAGNAAKVATKKPAQAAPAAQQPADEPAAKPQPDEFDEMNAEKESDTREMLTLAKAAKFNNVLGRIAAGVEVATAFGHYRFDDDTLAILRAATTGTRLTIAFGDNAFKSLIAAVEAQKNVTNICGHIQFADQNTANAWELAVKMCNKQ